MDESSAGTITCRGTTQIPKRYIIDAQRAFRREVVSAIDWESREITTFLTRTAEARS